MAIGTNPDLARSIDLYLLWERQTCLSWAGSMMKSPGSTQSINCPKWSSTIPFSTHPNLNVGFNLKATKQGQRLKNTKSKSPRRPNMSFKIKMQIIQIQSSRVLKTWEIFLIFTSRESLSKSSKAGISTESHKSKLCFRSELRKCPTLKMWMKGWSSKSWLCKAIWRDFKSPARLRFWILRRRPSSWNLRSPSYKVKIRCWRRLWSSFKRALFILIQRQIILSKIFFKTPKMSSQIWRPNSPRPRPPSHT